MKNKYYIVFAFEDETICEVATDVNQVVNLILAWRDLYGDNIVNPGAIRIFNDTDSMNAKLFMNAFFKNETYGKAWVETFEYEPELSYCREYVVYGLKENEVLLLNNMGSLKWYDLDPYAIWRLNE